MSVSASAQKAQAIGPTAKSINGPCKRNSTPILAPSIRKGIPVNKPREPNLMSDDELPVMQRKAFTYPRCATLARPPVFDGPIRNHQKRVRSFGLRSCRGNRAMRIKKIGVARIVGNYRLRLICRWGQGSSRNESLGHRNPSVRACHRNRLPSRGGLSTTEC